MIKNVIIVILLIALCVVLARPSEDKKAWLAECAKRTHGTLENELDARCIGDWLRDPQHVPTNQYVQSKSGKRIDFGDKYENE